MAGSFGWLLALLVLLAGAARADDAVEVIARFGKANPPGNVAVTPDGRLIMSQHPFFQTDQRVVEVLPNGTTQPFPNQAWASPRDPDGIGLNAVLGVRADRRGIVWLLDQSAAADGGGVAAGGRLIGWDTRTDRLFRVIDLSPPTIRPDSFLNDFAIDPVHQAIFIADSAGPATAALIVVDLTTGQSRRVLENTVVTAPEPVDLTIGERTVTVAGEPARVGVDGITIDAASRWVYFGSLSGTALYRVRARDLADMTLDQETLLERIERYADKPLSDGISIDDAGNIYVTDLANSAIGVIAAGTRAYRILHQDETLLSWPDGISVGPEGWLYVTVNQLHRSAPLNDGEDRASPPFYLVRVPALGPATVGR